MAKSAWAVRHGRILDAIERLMVVEQRVFDRWHVALTAERYAEARVLVGRYDLLRARERRLWRAAHACYPTPAEVARPHSGLISRTLAEALASGRSGHLA